VQGIPQDPQKFLLAGEWLEKSQLASLNQTNFKKQAALKSH
jgi:hypothetical protein